MNGRRQPTLHARRRQPPLAAAGVPRGSTLLALVLEVQRRIADDSEVVRVVRFLINSGAVVLTGTFAGLRIPCDELDDDERSVAQG
jgi:hypothetical protein